MDRLHVKLQVAVPARLEAALLALILDPLVHCPSVKRQSVFPRELFPTFRTDESQALVLELDVLYEPGLPGGHVITLTAGEGHTQVLGLSVLFQIIPCGEMFITVTAAVPDPPVLDLDVLGETPRVQGSVRTLLTLPRVSVLGLQVSAQLSFTFSSEITLITNKLIFCFTLTVENINRLGLMEFFLQ